MRGSTSLTLVVSSWRRRDVGVRLEEEEDLGGAILGEVWEWCLGEVEVEVCDEG